VVGADLPAETLVGHGDSQSDHHLIETGPYALVRHPINTGLLLSTLATAVQRGRMSALVGLALMALGWYVKARLEERFLLEQLGPDEYDAYARRVPMLVPFCVFDVAR
jgi:protein-S-isoprenylcysteine O-methyltransferase Ste14